jgi:hypothetical protein
VEDMWELLLLPDIPASRVHFLEDQALPAKSENAQTKNFTKQMSAS